MKIPEKGFSEIIEGLKSGTLTYLGNRKRTVTEKLRSLFHFLILDIFNKSMSGSILDDTLQLTFAVIENRRKLRMLFMAAEKIDKEQREQSVDHLFFCIVSAVHIRYMHDQSALTKQNPALCEKADMESRMSDKKFF